MPWYQAVSLIGSAAALSVMVLVRPSSDTRMMWFTLLVGALVVVSIGLAVKQVVTAAYLAAWLAS